MRKSVTKRILMLAVFIPFLLFLNPPLHAQEDKDSFLKEAKQLIRDLKSDDVKTRLKAAFSMPRLWKKEAVELFIEALNDKSGYVRTQAVEALMRIGDERAIEPLRKVWKHDEEKKPRTQAALALAKEFDDKEAFNYLLTGLKAPSWFDRSNAVEALGEIGGKRVVEPLLGALKDRDDSVRMRAATALGQVGDKSAVDALINALGDPSESVRLQVIRSLGLIGDVKALKPVLSAMKDKSSYVRRFAAGALGNIGRETAVPALVEALGDDSWEVRMNAAISLEDIGDKRAFDPLSKVLSDKHPIVRAAATRALGKIGGADALGLLIEVLEQDTCLPACRHAAEALGRIGDQKAVEPLIEALQSEFSYDPGAAKRAPLRIVNEKTLEAMARRLSEEFMDAVVQALKKLTKQKFGRDYQRWHNWLLKQPHKRKELKQRIDQLAKKLKDKDVYVRYSAAAELGKLADRMALKPLVGALGDEDSYVRHAAAEALGKVADPGAVEPLLGLLKDKETSVRTEAASSLKKITGRDFGENYDKWKEWSEKGR